jgi:cytochrome c-type protein NapC
MAGRIRRTWHWLRRPHARYGAGTLLLAGIVVGLLGWGGFSAGVAYSNTMDFCTSCHEMREFVYTEYQETPHYNNPSGVRVECSDCHVPRAFLPKMARKIQATFVEVPSSLMGTIKTRERFEEHRLRLAENVWRDMKASDSRECRECHSEAAMLLDGQKPRARAQHQDALTTGETCIDCHKGIAHKLPVMPVSEDAEAEEDDFEL